MRQLSVVIYQRDFSAPITAIGARYQINNYSHAAIGGPDRATITAYGNEQQLFELMERLRAPIEIHDWRGVTVWWGFVYRVSVRVGAIEVGASLEKMYNRVAVAYSMDGGRHDRLTTEWAENADGIATYGVKELKESLSSGNLESAVAKRNTILERSQYPPPLPPRMSDRADALSATLDCRGWWHTLGWQYFAQAAGLEAYTVSGSGMQDIGRDSTSSRVAQSFSTTLSWATNEVEVSLRKEGAPSDSARLELCANSSGQPGSVLAAGEVTANDMDNSLGYVKFRLNGTVNLAAGTTYWIVVSRTGGLNSANYYKINLNEEAGYSRGVFRYNRNGSWVQRDPDADMLFRVTGSAETTAQIEDMVTRAGQFITGTIIDVNSGISTNPYRDGDRRAIDEILELLKTGTQSKRRLLATVTPERIVKVYEEPAYNPDQPMLFLDSNGTLTNIYGTKVLAHTCPVGGWCQLRDVFPPTLDTSRLIDPSKFFIERNEYNPASGKPRLEVRDINSNWDLIAFGEY